MTYKTRCWLTILIMFGCWLTILIMFGVCVFSSIYLTVCAALGVYFGTRIAYKYRGHAPYFDRNKAHHTMAL